MLCYLLDTRTVNSGLRDQESLSTAFYALGTTYVDFVKRATKFHLDKKVKQWHEERKKENKKQKRMCGEKDANISIGNGKVPKKVPIVEKSKKAGSLKFVSGLTLGKYDESDDAWDFLYDDIETDEVNISQDTEPEPEPYVEPYA